MRPESAALQSTWRAQRTWSLVADQIKRRIEVARTFILALVVATAVLETLAAQVSNTDLRRSLAIAGAAVAAAAGVFQASSGSGERLKKWTRARSASEALKEQVYRYLSGTGAYATDADAQLNREQARVLGAVGDLQGLAAGIEPPKKPIPDIENVPSYVAGRVERQINGYYRPKAKENAAKAKAWKGAQTVLLFMSAVTGGVIAVAPNAGLGAWVSVITTTAGAIGAHIEAARYEYLAMSYQTTAARLEALRVEWVDQLSKRALTPDEAADFVNRCELAISAENESWMAGWVKGA